MIIIRLSGGIGNQLFQYCIGYALSKKNGFPLLFDISSFNPKSIRQFLLGDIIPDLSIISKPLLSTIVHPQNKIKRMIGDLIGLQRVPKVVETSMGYSSQIANINYPCFLKGSFISYKYFEEYNNEIISKLKFSESHKQQAFNSLAGMLSENLVCVSIRRGDFLNYHSLNVCGKSYYQAGIDYFRRNMLNPKFLFFSDDIDWAKKEFVGDDCFYWDIKNYQILMKLYAMSLCSHFIISNSSYSWWGCWLNPNPKKVVVCPAKVVSDNSLPVDDYYLPHWIKISP